MNLLGTEASLIVTGGVVFWLGLVSFLQLLNSIPVKRKKEINERKLVLFIFKNELVLYISKITLNLY
jgi:hypothetical protein